MIGLACCSTTSATRDNLPIISSVLLTKCLRALTAATIPFSSSIPVFSETVFVVAVVVDVKVEVEVEVVVVVLIDGVVVVPSILFLTGIKLLTAVEMVELSVFCCSIDVLWGKRTFITRRVSVVGSIVLVVITVVDESTVSLLGMSVVFTVVIVVNG